ncbi:unnamed protein product [Debaryomyces tyrocola]|nr:unnamed protein product [Debaryomyces tyrocola]
MKLCELFFISFIVSLVNAKTHTWYFKTTWVDANPDGVEERKVIGFNDTWPIPTLRVGKGDRINLYLTNGFDTANTTLHFHGLFQNGSSQMDGPEMVTQCPIPAGETMLYNFTVADQVGTFWYHSHTKGQKLDGMRAPFIIEDDDYPFDFDEEVVLSLSEWYHEKADDLIDDFMNRYNPTGAEPIPANILFNETRNNSWVVEPNKTYFVRIVNIGAFVSQYIWMEDHEFEVVEVDGKYVENNKTDMLYITVAQRYGVLIKTKNSTDKNYAMMTRFDDGMLDVIPDELELNSTNYMVYNKDKDLPKEYKVDSVDDFLDDFYLTPLNKEKLYDDADHAITIDVAMDNLGDGINYAFFNNITYVRPKLPPLMTVLSSGEHATNELVYGTNTHTYVLQENDVIDIVLNNGDDGRHPFHLHGHVFQLIARGPAITEGDPVEYADVEDDVEFPEYPMMRDVVYVEAQSYMVLRFKADNPGVWFFHCHIDWHLIQGLAIVLIEAPLAIQADPRQKLQDDVKRHCEMLDMPYEGNAAGNSKDYLDLTGQNVQVADLPSGFTARGIVALVFSCIAGFLGIAMIAVYGMADIPDVEERVARDLDIDIGEDEANNTSSMEQASSIVEERTH